MCSSATTVSPARSARMGTRADGRRGSSESGASSVRCIARMASMRRARSSACDCAMRFTLALVRRRFCHTGPPVRRDLRHREAEIAGAFDELQRVDVARAILPVAVVATRHPESRPSVS